MSISINPYPFTPKGSSSYDDTAIKNELEKKAEKFSDLDDFIKIGPINDAQILMKNFKDFDLANKVGQPINCVIKREHFDLEYIPAVLIVEDYRDKYAGWRLTFTFAFTSGYSDAQTDSEIYSPDATAYEQVVSYLYKEDYGYVIPLGKGSLVSKAEKAINETLQSFDEQMLKPGDVHKINGQSILQTDIKTKFIAEFEKTTFSEIKEALNRGECVMAEQENSLYHLVFASNDQYVFTHVDAFGFTCLSVNSDSNWFFDGSYKSQFYDNDSQQHYPSSYALYQGLLTKQDVLKSGTNIKTVNGESLLGSGDIAIDPTCFVRTADEAQDVIIAGKLPVYRTNNWEYYPLTYVGDTSSDTLYNFSRITQSGIETIVLGYNTYLESSLKASDVINSTSSNSTFPTSKAVFDVCKKGKVHIDRFQDYAWLSPNKYYILDGTDADVRIHLESIDSDVQEEYIIEYTAKNTRIEWPEYTTWPNRTPPPNTDGKIYQVRIINSLGTFTEFPRPIINFTIGDTAVQGELNMTWEEWVNSEYNTVLATITDGLIMVENKIVAIDESYVSSTDVITPKKSYTLLEAASKNDMLVGTYNQSATSTGGATLGTAYLPSIAVDSNGNFTVTALFGNSSNSPTVSATFDGNTTLTIPGGWTHPMFGPMSDDIVFDIDFETMTLTARSSISAGGWATITGYKLIKK